MRGRADCGQPYVSSELHCWSRPVCCEICSKCAARCRNEIGTAVIEIHTRVVSNRTADGEVTDNAAGKVVDKAAVNDDTPDYIARVLVQANRSMSWRGNLYIAAGIAVVCFSIAAVFAFFGLWLVIPFAGLEVIFVTLCLYWTVKRLSRKEIITVDERVITLEWGYNQPDVSVILPRHWSRLKYDHPKNAFDVGDLSLTAYGKRYELGASLGREEKKELYRELKNILSICDLERSLT